jgi:hypothetical protein
MKYLNNFIWDDIFINYNIKILKVFGHFYEQAKIIKCIRLNIFK